MRSFPAHLPLAQMDARRDGIDGALPSKEDELPALTGFANGASVLRIQSVMWRAPHLQRVDRLKAWCLPRHEQRDQPAHCWPAASTAASITSRGIPSMFATS